jgi:hypothetical protein
MKALYITSVEPYSGKTATCLAIAKKLQAAGHQVGYLKPLSTQPWRSPDGVLSDEDAAFVSRTLGLETDLAELAPVVVTPERLRARLKGEPTDDLLQVIRQAAERAGRRHAVIVVEGGASLREGYAMGLSNLKVAEVIGAPALVLVRYRGEMAVVDDALTAQFRLREQLLGVVLNRVPEEANDFLREYGRPFLEAQGVRVLGSLPQVPRLSALSVGELIDLLGAQVLTASVERDALVETYTIGAMTADAALARFRRQLNKAVITGGDRTDIQLAALETSTVALILTGNLHPSPLIIQQAESAGVPVLLTRANTIDAVEAIERVHGKTRLGQPEKLEAFTQLVTDNLDLEGIYAAVGL